MDSLKGKTTLWSKGKRAAIASAGIVALAVSFSPRLHAQAFNNGGTAALGNFLNPPSVKDAGGQTCNYDVLVVDLSQGKVFARPFKNSTNSACSGSLTVAGISVVDITTILSPGFVSGNAAPFSIPPAGPIVDGVLQVGTFTLQPPSVTGAGTPTNLCPPSFGCAIQVELIFVPNANNTPVTIVATGNVNIATGTWMDLRGSQGAAQSGIIRGVGGQGGPGGFRGGDGGYGGLAPTAGSTGFGPGGGVGGAVSAGSGNTGPTSTALFLTSGNILPPNGSPVQVPVGNDLGLLLRGGSGGAGGGGGTTTAGAGGGGGGGAILITSNGTITVNGVVDAEGGDAGGAGGSGSGGMIRLVASTIAGAGYLDTSDYGSGCCTGSGAGFGLVRMEAFTNTFTASLNSHVFGVTVSAASAPGQITLPATAPVFLQFASVTDEANGANTVNVPALPQATPGRTGTVTAPDFTMPSTAGLVDVVINAGPFSASTALSGKSVTLVVTPLDQAQGGSKTYTETISCGASCSAVFNASNSNAVTLPLGEGTMSAFMVVNLTAGGTLARMFPATYQGEEIESVRLNASGHDTNYVLISKAGHEFPFVPGERR